MDPVRKSALLWGLVGSLCFGVLYQGRVLLGAQFDAAVLVGGMATVGAVTVGCALVVENRLTKESL